MKLKIRAVGPNDFGTYRCVAKNSLGETDGNIKLDGEWHCAAHIHIPFHVALTVCFLFIPFNSLIYCILFVVYVAWRTARKKLWKVLHFPVASFFVLIVERLTCDIRPFVGFWKLHYSVACKYRTEFLSQKRLKRQGSSYVGRNVQGKYYKVYYYLFYNLN